MTPAPATGAVTKRVASVAELGERLRARPGRVRLVGGGSRQDRLPDPGPALRLDLTALCAIVRLDAPDQTCTVECGVRREHLDQELASAGLELPCPGAGTIGGLFASDPVGAATQGGFAPRGLLLGMEAYLADGTSFRSGARVVKSVAGFDVHKLLVGSRGRLFVATHLHLRLKPRPRAEQWFAVGDLEPPRALALVAALRAEAVPPAALQLARSVAGACVVRGRLAGRARHVADSMRRLDLTASEPCWRDHLVPPTDGEVLAGLVLPSQLPMLLAQLPAGAPLLWHGGGRYEVAMPTPAATDALLAVLGAQTLAAAVVRGAATRIGHGTPVEPTLRDLEDKMQQALDPHGILV